MMYRMTFIIFGLVAFTIQAAPQTTTTNVHVPLPSQSRVSLGIIGGLATTGGDYGGSFLTGVSVQVDRTSPVFLGLDSGILFGSGTGIPVLASILFKLSERGVRPYVAGTVGPVIGVGGNGIFSGGIGAGDSVKLAVLVRPGLTFRAADALDVRTEVIVGGLTGIFFISPMLGMSVYL